MADDRYEVPEILVEIRALRRQPGPQSLLMERLPPSLMYSRCDLGAGVLTAALYQHAFVEAGYIVMPGTQDPYPVCPICGFVF